MPEKPTLGSGIRLDVALVGHVLPGLGHQVETRLDNNCSNKPLSVSLLEPEAGCFNTFARFTQKLHSLQKKPQLFSGTLVLVLFFICFPAGEALSGAFSVYPSFALTQNGSNGVQHLGCTVAT